MLPQPGAKLDLTQLHSAVHNLVLSRREDVGFWKGPFETAWAGFVFAGHSASNQDEIALNLVKGELLGDKRPADPCSASELAACYMIAAFLQRVNAPEIAKDFITLADTRVLQIAAHIDLGERFHLFSTPEYLYAIVLAHHITQQKMPNEVANMVLSSLDRIRDAAWHQSGYVFALAGTAYLIAHSYSEAACQAILQWVVPRLNNVDKVDEHLISLVWFLENNWPSIRPKVSEAQQKSIDEASIRLRSKLLHSLGQFDFQLAWCPPMEVEYEEPISDALVVVSTVELLMLDEIAEKHSVQSYVLTQEEVDRHSLLTTVFDVYKRLVDEKLAELGLSDGLDAIYKGLEDDNPASWRDAILGCRNVFYDLSRILWQVPGDEYKIPGAKVLNVKNAPGNERSRLTAYLHYCGASKSKEPVFMAQFEAVSDLMHAIVNRSAKAKHIISRDEALSLLIAMYVLLAEMIVLTGLEPATKSN